MAVKDIKPSTKIDVYNNIFNRVGFELASGRRIDLDRNGQFKKVTVEDLDYLLSVAPAMLKEGIIFIKDEDVRKYLDISSYYDDGVIVASELIDSILEQSAEELEDTIKKASNSAKKEIAKKAQEKADDLTGGQVKAIEKGTGVEITEKI
jgi:hypothetical protein